MSSTGYDLIVVGGGLVGLSVAYRAVQHGARTLVVDARMPGQATDAGAGIVAPESTTRYGDLWYRFAREAVAHYQELVARLEEDGVHRAGLETGFSRCPKLVVAMDEEEMVPFQEAQQLLQTREAERAPPLDQAIRPISPQEAQTFFPPLARPLAALLQPVAHRVDGRKLAQALGWAVQARGATFHSGEVVGLLQEGHRVLGVELADGSRLRAEATVIAGGAWSARLGRSLDIHIPVEPQKGQILHLEAPEGALASWAIVGGFRGHYLVPWPDGRIAAGATRETGSGYDVHPTLQGLQEVAQEALRVAPGLASFRFREVRVGLRPVTPDLLPILGQVPGRQGVYLATGHGPTGLTLGPYSGHLVADLALRRPVGRDLTPFALDRFQEAR